MATRTADGWDARRLLRAARSGTLATVGDGEPHAALVTPATDPAGDVILLLSGLSAHTRLLRADGRCALMVAGDAPDPNPQTAPRVTVHGRAVPLGSADAVASARARYLAIHPYAALYADFGDFGWWVLSPVRALFVGGFGRARTLATVDLVPDRRAADAVAREAPALLALAGPDAAAVDTDGVDRLGADGRTRRDAFDAPATDADAVRAALARPAAPVLAAPVPLN